MEPISEAERDGYFTAYRREALHFEMRDIYATDIERDRFATWLRGEPLDKQAEAEWWRPWFEGYGEPDIDLFRLVLLTTGSGAARRGAMLRRLLASGTWDDLLDVSALHPGDGRAARRR